MVVFQSFFLNVCAVLSVFIWCVYLYLTRTFDHWKKKGVTFKPPHPLFGNFIKLFFQQKRYTAITQDIYNAFPEESFVGIFVSSIPCLLIRNPELIKQILIKDFQYFHDRSVTLDDNIENDLFTKNLLTLPGRNWKHLRQKLTPTFSSSKIKAMFHLIVEQGNNFGNVLQSYANSKNIFEARELSAKYTTEVISSISFGIDANTSNDLNVKFREMGRQALIYFNILIRKCELKYVIPYYGLFTSKRTVPEYVHNFFVNIVRDGISNRKANNITRNDFLQLLMQLQDHEFNDKDGRNLVFDDVFLAAQTLVFIVGGFDTTSGVMSFILYELAINPDIQLKLQEEIDKVLQKHDGQLTYDALQELTYLDQVLSEGLRKYPPANHLERICTVPYTIPGTNVALNKNDWVSIPIYALHHDPQYFPNPSKFDPERFSAEGKKEIRPCSYLPFGEGPRMCIAQRFARKQIIIGLVSTLKKFTVRPCFKTKTTLEFNIASPNLESKDGLWLQIQNR